MNSYISDKTKKRVKRVSLIALICCIVLVAAIIVDYAFYGDPVEKLMFTVTRTGTADEIPSLPGNITDVRITVKDRSAFCSSRALLLRLFGGMETKQIYYGYCSDGIWYDYPCENYLIRPFSKILNDNAAEASLLDHCAQIGPYLLLAFPFPGTSDVLGVVEDSIDSSVVQMTEYGTDWPDGGAKCARVVDSVIGEYASDVYDTFYNWYYIIVEYDSLPKDYKVTVDQYVKYDGISEADEADLYTMTGIDGETCMYQHMLSETYTYEDIQSALSREYD